MAKAAAPRRAAPKPAPPRMTLAEVMAALEAAGSEQTRRTYARHGATDPMFGVSFATLQTLRKRLKVDHQLALALWDTGNFDARNLAFKLVDPQQLDADALDRWASEPNARMCGSYIAQIAAEGPHGHASVARWLASPGLAQRINGWKLVGTLATLDESLADDWFLARLGDIETDIHAADNGVRDAMNSTLISIGCRNPALRHAASAAAQRIGKVVVDHGDTACKTPDARDSLAKAWAHAEAKGAASPAAQERARESMRLRC